MTIDLNVNLHSSKKTDSKRLHLQSNTSTAKASSASDLRCPSPHRNRAQHLQRTNWSTTPTACITVHAVQDRCLVACRKSSEFSATSSKVRHHQAMVTRWRCDKLCRLHSARSGPSRVRRWRRRLVIRRRRTHRGLQRSDMSRPGDMWIARTAAAASMCMTAKCASMITVRQFVGALLGEVAKARASAMPSAQIIKRYLEHDLLKAFHPACTSGILESFTLRSRIPAA